MKTGNCKKQKRKNVDDYNNVFLVFLFWTFVSFSQTILYPNLLSFLFRLLTYSSSSQATKFTLYCIVTTYNRIFCWRRKLSSPKIGRQTAEHKTAQVRHPCKRLEGGKSKKAHQGGTENSSQEGVITPCGYSWSFSTTQISCPVLVVTGVWDQPLWIKKW